MTAQFGVNLNNREPLIAPDYSLADLLDLGVLVEELGFESAWVGDSLFSKPRYEPMALLSALSQRTSRVRLGTACLVTSTRNPLYTALEWATLDHLSGGRTIFGPCMGNPEEGVRREFAAVGLDYSKKARIFEEGLEVLRTLWTEGRVTFHGEHYQYDDVSFSSGTEMAPLAPIQKPPPFWIVSNPRLVSKGGDDARIGRYMDRAARRIVRLGDGWMTCCRAQRPEELVEQLSGIRAVAEELERSLDGFVVSYQVTMNIGDSEAEARRAFDDYISKYYPELSQAMDLSNWGPVGTPEEIAQWLATFEAAGCDYFICRFGDLDQFSQVTRFANEVLPAYEALTTQKAR
jgi:alkanesulfonate monooxygenase SsuD/methylene tetrahydromethanopterin reductase-like flavin-dependent oxidoreductase (luciferase family)